MSRPTQDTARYNQAFAYGGITHYADTFQSLLLTIICPQRSPTTPDASIWFALIRFRSPLLPESRLISTPLATEMFHFTRFAPRRVTCFATCWVAPFGNPRIKASWQLPEAYRSLVRPSSPLLAKASTICP